MNSNWGSSLNTRLYIHSKIDLYFPRLNGLLASAHLGMNQWFSSRAMPVTDNDQEHLEFVEEPDFEPGLSDYLSVSKKKRSGVANFRDFGIDLGMKTMRKSLKKLPK